MKDDERNMKNMKEKIKEIYEAIFLVLWIAMKSDRRFFSYQNRRFKKIGDAYLSEIGDSKKSAILFFPKSPIQKNRRFLFYKIGDFLGIGDLIAIPE